MLTNTAKFVVQIGFNEPNPTLDSLYHFADIVIICIISKHDCVLHLVKLLLYGVLVLLLYPVELVLYEAALLSEL